MPYLEYLGLLELPCFLQSLRFKVTPCDWLQPLVNLLCIFDCCIGNALLLPQAPAQGLLLQTIDGDALAPIELLMSSPGNLFAHTTYRVFSRGS
jgi:hypothetical protein